MSVMEVVDGFGLVRVHLCDILGIVQRIYQVLRQLKIQLAVYWGLWIEYTMSIGNDLASVRLQCLEFFNDLGYGLALGGYGCRYP